MKKTFFYTLIAAIFISLTGLTGCSKDNTINDLNAQVAGKENGKTPGTGILNQNLVITYARDNGADITQQFAAFTFKFVGNYPSGEAQVWNDLLAQTGSWSGDAMNFTIAYPTTIFDQLAFLNRQWIIAANTPGILTLTGADGDEVRMAVKEQEQP